MEFWRFSESKRKKEIMRKKRGYYDLAEAEEKHACIM